MPSCRVSEPLPASGHRERQAARDWPEAGPSVVLGLRRSPQHSHRFVPESHAGSRAMAQAREARCGQHGHRNTGLQTCLGPGSTSEQRRPPARRTYPAVMQVFTEPSGGVSLSSLLLACRARLSCRCSQVPDEGETFTGKYHCCEEMTQGTFSSLGTWGRSLCWGSAGSTLGLRSPAPPCPQPPEGLFSANADTGSTSAYVFFLPSGVRQLNWPGSLGARRESPEDAACRGLRWDGEMQSRDPRRPVLPAHASPKLRPGSEPGGGRHHVLLPSTAGVAARLVELSRCISWLPLPASPGCCCRHLFPKIPEGRPQRITDEDT